MSASQLTTQKDVFKLPAPSKGEAVYYDNGKPTERVTGLTLRVRAAGSRKWVFYYRFNGAQKRVGLGDAATVSLDEARKAARKLRVAVDEGRDPAYEKAEKRTATKLSFASVMADYLAERAGEMKKSSFEQTTWYLKTHWQPLHGFPIGNITRAIVATRLGELKTKHGPTGANRGRSSLSAMYSWAIGAGLCDVNPVAGTNKNKETSRERVLSDAELVKIWQAAPDNAYGRIIKLLMLTGQRRDEIGGLRWSEVVDTMIALPGSRTKNGRAHDVPLSSLALSVLESQHRIVGRDLVFGEGEGGFANWSRSKVDLDAACKVKDWVLHDLRRTAATRMADLGVQPHIIEAVLNHASGHKAGVAGIYNRAAYAAEKRAALELWANHLSVALAKADGANVVELPKARA